MNSKKYMLPISAMPIPLPSAEVEHVSDGEEVAVPGQFPALCVHCLEEVGSREIMLSIVW